MDTQFNREDDNFNCVDSDNVTLNGFMFCNRHGLEVCSKCPTDNRFTNNETVEGFLHEKLTPEELETKWKGDERTPFAVTKNWTRGGNGKPCCMSHKEVACQECFNWGDKIVFEIQGGKKVRKTTRRSKGTTGTSRLE